MREIQNISQKKIEKTNSAFDVNYIRKTESAYFFFYFF